MADPAEIGPEPSGFVEHAFSLEVFRWFNTRGSMQNHRVMIVLD